MTALPLTHPPQYDTPQPLLFRILGPVEVGHGSIPTSKKERQVLALLALKPGVIVHRREFAEELWDGEPPPSTPQLIQTYVMRLRRALVPEFAVTSGRGVHGLDNHPLIVTRPVGYMLDLDPDQVDACRFHRLVDSARRELMAERFLVALDYLVAAFSLWRGRPLLDFDLGATVSRLVCDIEDKHHSAVVMRTQIDLHLGRHRAVVDELASLVRANPTREDLVGLLMVALYRSQRRVDALQAFQAARARMAEEYGLDPCPDLWRLHQQILAGDPSLELNGETR